MYSYGERAEKSINVSLFTSSSHRKHRCAASHQVPSLKCCLRNLGLALLALLISDVTLAFPPAPSWALYGIVRDQVGQTVTAEGAEVILLKGGVEVVRTPSPLHV